MRSRSSARACGCSPTERSESWEGGIRFGGRDFAINRHSSSPDGWIHWQDNTKMSESGGEMHPIVQEYVLITYTRFNSYDVASADRYWDATKGYWAAVRAKWTEVANAKGGIAIREEARTGTVIAGRLLELAGEVLEDKRGEAAAIAEARRLIEDNTTRIGA